MTHHVKLHHRPELLQGWLADIKANPQSFLMLLGPEQLGELIEDAIAAHALQRELQASKVHAPVRICAKADIACSRGCGSGPCVREDAQLERAKQIRERVTQLEAEVQRLLAEHEALTGGPWRKPDADDIAWATRNRGVAVACRLCSRISQTVGWTCTGQCQRKEA